MDTIHWQLFELIGMLGAPFIFAFIATAFAWRFVSHRTLFLVISVLVFAGLSSFAFPLANDVFNPSRSERSIFPSPQFNALVAHAFVTAVLGFPIMHWLSKALRVA